MSIWLFISTGAWLIGSLGAYAASRRRFQALLQVMALVAFGGGMWGVADLVGVQLPLHGLLWLCVLGGLPWLMQRPRPQSLWLVVQLAALVAALWGFGLNDIWLSVGGLLLLALFGLGAWRVSPVVAVLWGFGAVLMLLTTVEVIGGQALNLAMLTTLSLLASSVLHFGIQLAARQSWALAPRLLQGWTLMFSLLGAFVPLTLLLDPAAVQPIVLTLPIGLLLLGVLTSKGWLRQRPYFQAAILWGAFVLSIFLPEGEHTLSLRAVTLAVSGVLAQAVALHRSSPRQRNTVLVRMAIILVVLGFGLQFRNLDIM